MVHVYAVYYTETLTINSQLSQRLPSCLLKVFMQHKYLEFNSSFFMCGVFLCAFPSNYQQFLFTKVKLIVKTRSQCLHVHTEKALPRTSQKKI